MEDKSNEQKVPALIRNEFESYVDRMMQIRSLATPTLDEVRIPDDYSHVLKINFQHIGEMAAENRKFIADYIQPVLKSEEPLSLETRDEIEYLNKLLVNDKTMGEIDIHLSQRLISRLFRDEISSGEKPDENDRIILLSRMLRRDYYLITEMSRSQYAKSGVQVIRGRQQRFCAKSTPVWHMSCFRSFQRKREAPFCFPPCSASCFILIFMSFMAMPIMMKCSDSWK